MRCAHPDEVKLFLMIDSVWRVTEEEADRLAGGDSKPSSDEGGDEGEDELPSHRVATTPRGKPRPEAQRNFTDPDIILQKEFVPQWPSDNNSVNHVRRKGQCGTNS